MPNPNVVLGIVGSNLDRGGNERWNRWRPSVDLVRHDDLVVDRFELLHLPPDGSIVDQVRDDIAGVSPETEVVPRLLDVRDPWDFEEVYASLHDFARQYEFRPESEDYLVHVTTGTHVVQICLFLLTEARYLPGRLLQTSPPRRRTTNQPGRYTVIDLDLSKYDRLASRFVAERQQGLSVLKAGIETRNAAFNQLIEQIEQVAIASTAPLLLTGPTGAGKSQLARRVFDLKRQRRQVDGPLVEVNCATLRGDTAMSTLFGHVKGAFTGATHDRPGLMRAAQGGVLFLDEIGELGLDEQAMLLRAIEVKSFLPLGADREVSSDFQLIAGTNRDLVTAVADGRFREDLLARINLWTFRLPGLEDRREDIEPNLDYEIERCSKDIGTHVTMNLEARKRFLEFATAPSSSWRGNFRDFNAALTRMATLATGGRINHAIVVEETKRLRDAWSPPGAPDSIVEDILGREEAERIDRFDRAQLVDVLTVCRNSDSLSDAGRKLFAISRRRKKTANDADRLRKYLAKFDLTWRDVQGQ